MWIMIETEKDEGKSCAVHGLLNTCSVDRNETFVELSEQWLQRDWWITAKPRTCSIQTIFTKWLFFTLCIFKPHRKIFEAKSTHPKVCQCRRTSGQTKSINTTNFQFQGKLLVLVGKCVLWDQILAIREDGEKLFYVELQTVVKGKKFQGCHTAGMCFRINDDENLSLILSVPQNLDFKKSTKHSWDMWKQF